MLIIISLENVRRWRFENFIAYTIDDGNNDNGNSQSARLKTNFDNLLAIGLVAKVLLCVRACGACVFTSIFFLTTSIIML